MGMGDFSNFFLVVSKICTLLSWPPFWFIFPLYASIVAIESDSNSKNQQCLSYWVLFSLVKILEMALGKLFQWFPFWPCAKGIASVLLVIPYFSGASYVYKHFIRPNLLKDSQIGDVLLIQRNESYMLNEQTNFLDTSPGNIVENETEELVMFQGKSVFSYDTTGKGCCTWQPSPMKIQKEWSCALCLMNATSEKSLNEHLQGKKHKAKEEELIADERNDRMVLLRNFNPVAWANIEKWSDVLNPVSISVRLCKWEKPEYGWTKLNTDGSIDRKNAGFGGLFRDHMGNPLCAFVSKATRGDVFSVELWAIWRGLVLALSLKIKVIWVESDSMSVVKTINKQQSHRPKAGSCLEHIWEMLKKFDKYKVSHSWRETNRAADCLAKMTLKGTDVVLWPADFPKSLRNIIEEDAQGMVYTRV